MAKPNLFFLPKTVWLQSAKWIRSKCSSIGRGMEYLCRKKSSKRKKLEKGVRKPQNSGTKKVNTPRKNSGWQLRRTSHAGSPETFRSGYFAAYLAGITSFWSVGETWIGKVHAGCFRSLWSWPEERFLYVSGERKSESSKSRCGQIGWKPKTRIAMCFSETTTQHIFNRSKCLKPDFTWYRFDPDNLPSVCKNLPPDQFRRSGSAPPNSLKFAKENRYAKFSWIGHYHQDVRSLAQKLSGTNGGLPSCSLRAIALTYRILTDLQESLLAPPANWESTRWRAEGLRTVANPFSEILLTQREEALNGVAIGADDGREIGRCWSNSNR